MGLCSASLSESRRYINIKAFVSASGLLWLPASSVCIVTVVVKPRYCSALRCERNIARLCYSKALLHVVCQMDAHTVLILLLQL